jgi:dTMP kinase
VEIDTGMKNPGGNSRKGFFISFEGIDGSGKSVQAERLYGNLKNHGYPVVLIREPGGTEISEKIRSILLDCRHGRMAPLAELFLYEAARAQLVDEKIGPELERKHVVLTDRFADSTLAYQAYGRRLPLNLVIEANRHACGEVLPDRTFFLDIPLEESRRRMRQSGKKDRMEKEDESFFKRVRKGYLEISREETDRIVVLDGMKPMEVLEREILQDAVIQLKIRNIEKGETKS